MARKPMMAGNWKMNNTVAEAVVLTQEISNQYEKEWPDVGRASCICPPYVDLKPAKTVLDFDKIEDRRGLPRTCTGSLRGAPTRARSRCP